MSREPVTMFVGTFEHTLDDKGRVVVPSDFRVSIADGAIVAKLERSLGLWLLDAFAARMATLKDQVTAGSLDADALRIYTAEATRVKPDSQGRIFLPAGLRLHGGLDAQVVFNGYWDRIEIWQEARWRQVMAGGDDPVVEAVEAGQI